MAAVSDELLSEQCIAQILENDLRLLESVKQAEKLQLDHVVAVSAQAQGGRIPKFSQAPQPELDVDLAFETYISDARTSNDAAYAQSIQNEIQAAIIQDWQYAQRVAAAERKTNLDADFARMLQALDDEGKDIDPIKDAESIIGTIPVDVDPNEQKLTVTNNIGSAFGKDLKGKGRCAPTIQSETYNHDNSKELHSPYPTCGICLELFLATHTPITASLSANSSARLPFGLRLPCPSEHGYCISCLTSYIQNKLDPEGIGAGKSGGIIFPIRCPECPLDVWADGIQDDVAERILGENGMVLWYHQKILDSLPRLFCPNPKCSSLVEADEESGEPEATCPVCQKVMCIPCRTSWHTGLTCEQYQALPMDERSPEDRLVLELAKAERWRRCPSCSVIVELVSGCNHMTCRCGFHFCFKCGSPTTKEGKCKRDPPCELWEEELLLDEQERGRHYPLAHGAAAQPAPDGRFAPQPPAPAARVVVQHQPLQESDGDLDWMDDPRILCGRHWFTTNMIRNLSCGYCGVQSNSLADLRHHLLHVRHHPVYACCGRFFRRDQDFERHEATLGAFGHHGYQLLRG